MSDTPETSAYGGLGWSIYKIDGLTLYERSKKLERERDEARTRLAELRKDKARLVRAAFTAGYCRGHNDTVEGCVSSPDEWDSAEWSALIAEAIDAAMAKEVES